MWGLIVKSFMEYKDCLIVIFSFVSVCLAGVSLFISMSTESKYSDNTHQVIINSAKLAEYNINVMKVFVMSPDEMKLGSFQNSYKALEENFETIKNVDVTRLPKEDSMNYQSYRLQFHGAIALIDLAMNIQKSDSGDDPTMSLKSSDKDRAKMKKALTDAEKAIKRCRLKLESSGLIYGPDDEQEREKLSQITQANSSEVQR